MDRKDIYGNQRERRINERRNHTEHNFDESNNGDKLRIEHCGGPNIYRNVLCNLKKKTPYKEALYPGARIRRQDTEQVSYLLEAHL